MLVAKDFRRRAADALRGNWGIAILTGLVAVLLGAQTKGGSSTGSVGSRLTDENTSDMMEYFFNSNFRSFLIGAGCLIIVWTIIAFIIGGVITLGYARFNLNLVDYTGAEFHDLFSEFERFGDGFCMQLLRAIYIFLWTLLLIIPGIVATYSYAMTPYILLEHPELSANEAIKQSKQLMSGNKWRLFCLEFSFIGWYILSVLTLGIGFLWLNPYIEASKAAFYRDLVGTISDEYYEDYSVHY